MKLMAAVLAVGLAVPALAAEKTTAVALSDSQLDQVAAGCETPTTTPTTTTPAASPTTNVNVSPIVVNQTAVAFSQQYGWAKHGKVNQNASNAAVNYAFINYHVKY
jgi:hypothetical protein